MPVFSTSAAVFDSLPLLGVGGGVQIGAKGGKSGSVFIDVNYMYYLGDTKIHNPYTDYPNPSIINYRRSVIGLGVGYKFGFINRK